MKTKLMLIMLSLFTILVTCSSSQKKRLTKFKSGDFKVLVCPVHILANQQSSHDTIHAVEIVEYINTNNYAAARLTDYKPPVNNEWRVNEAKMLTISINLFSEFAKGLNLPEDTYILHPEFLKSGENQTIFAVHYCLLDHQGKVVIRGLLNSKWEEFQKVDPKTNADCVDVFINGFDMHMKE